MFHPDGRSVDALLKHMPKRRIWDVEGRVHGTNLGNNKFLFDFEKDEDLEKVLQKRPCHFNKWSFALERWTPTIKEEFPNSILFWANVVGVPIHYKKMETFESVGKTLGTFDKADVEGSRVRVFVNGDLPLKFECKAGFENGDVVRVTIQYEDLYRHCFTCKRISHEEGTCSELDEAQIEKNRLARIAHHEREERATKEAFSQPKTKKQGPSTEIPSYQSRERESRRKEVSPLAPRSENRRDDRSSQDLRKKLIDKLPRSRERYHPYPYNSRALSRDKMRDSTSSSEWRPKPGPGNQDERHRAQRYDRQTDRHWERSRHMSSRNRASPYSQRTVSDAPRRMGSTTYYRGRSSRSPTAKGLEWQPVDKEKEEMETRGLLKRRNETSRRISDITEHGEEPVGKTIAGTQRLETETGIHLNLEARDEEQEHIGETSLLRIETSTPHERKDTGEEHEITSKTVIKDQRPRKEDELDKTIEEYAKMADLAMTKDMIDNDDLLDEDQDFEVYNTDEEMEDGRIEAISQLSPKPPSKPKALEMKNAGAETRPVEKEDRTTEALKQQTVKKVSSQSLIKGGNRGARSPDLKGAAASKKLASRGRLSPKSKMMKPQRDQGETSRQVPRYVVYPSANKSRKPVATSGSVVSQKPSSSRI
ncbi:hypothetical protein Bca52824_016834 [Brassica carinata]|uniref:DUF4283 domain-containing protein n=1 Tax=Brassica carinata TaxID=52824 RepID=A0A8X7W5U2_BRACI|nr:hypothetical protein Bca52824_016834 [Brassica carinata]